MSGNKKALLFHHSICIWCCSKSKIPAPVEMWKVTNRKPARSLPCPFRHQINPHLFVRGVLATQPVWFCNQRQLHCDRLASSTTVFSISHRIDKPKTIIHKIFMPILRHLRFNAKMKCGNIAPAPAHKAKASPAPGPFAIHLLFIDRIYIGIRKQPRWLLPRNNNGRHRIVSKLIGFEFSKYRTSAGRQAGALARQTSIPSVQ